MRDSVKLSTVCGDYVAAWLEGQNVPSMSPGQGNLYKFSTVRILASACP